MEFNRESDELQELLPLIEDVDKYIKQISEVVEIVAYITTRPSVVKNGTAKWLTKHKFPQAPIITRPSYIPHSNGNEWKADVLTFLYPNVIGIIDDNPSLVKFLPNDYKGKIFQYDCDSVSRNNLEVFACKDWETVVDTIKREFKN